MYIVIVQLSIANLQNRIMLQLPCTSHSYKGQWGGGLAAKFFGILFTTIWQLHAPDFKSNPNLRRSCLACPSLGPSTNPHRNPLEANQSLRQKIERHNVRQEVLVQQTVAVGCQIDCSYSRLSALLEWVVSLRPFL